MNMSICNAQIHLARQHLHLMVHHLTGEPLLRARLPLWPVHPRALLDLLESIASFCGHPLTVVLSADANCADLFEQVAWSDKIC